MYELTLGTGASRPTVGAERDSPFYSYFGRSTAIFEQLEVAGSTLQSHGSSIHILCLVTKIEKM